MGDVPDFLRILALIIIVYAGSFNMRVRVFKKVSEPSLRLAFIGVLSTTILLALAAHFLFGLSWLASLILGAILGGTSSEVIIAFQDAIPKTSNTRDVLLAESILNSPLSVLIPLILFDIFTNQATGGNVSLSVFYLSKFWQMMSAGVGTGLIIGYATGRTMKFVEKELTPLLSFAVALVTYSLSVSVGGSTSS